MRRMHERTKAMAIRVNGERIPEQAVLAELKRLIDFYAQHLSKAELGREMEVLVRRAKEHAIGTKLLLDEVKRRHVDVPQNEVDAAVAAMARKAGGDAAFDAMLARQHLTRDQLRNSVRVGKQLDALIARVTAGEPEPTEEEVRAYYEDHEDRYTAPDEVQVRHILMKPASGNDSDRDTVRSRLQGLKRQIEEGGDFAELAAAFSECPSGKSTGGSLGWVGRGTTVPEFDDAVFTMEVGDISDVVETALGLHIIEKLDEQPGEPLPFEEVRDRIRDLMRHERRGHALSRFVEKLKATVTIEEDDEDESKEEYARLLRPDAGEAQSGE